MQYNHDPDPSVSWWLRQIRNFTESYEPPIELCNNNNNTYENISFSRGNNRKRDCRLFLDAKQQRDWLLSSLGGEQDMTDVDAGHYENIWELQSGERRFELKHAHICRVSFDFNESVEEFGSVRGLSRDFSEDVMQWKNEIRFECSSEEESEEFTQVRYYTHA